MGLTFDRRSEFRGCESELRCRMFGVCEGSDSECGSGGPFSFYRNIVKKIVKKMKYSNLQWIHSPEPCVVIRTQNVLTHLNALQHTHNIQTLWKYRLKAKNSKFQKNISFYSILPLTQVSFGVLEGGGIRWVSALGMVATQIRCLVIRQRTTQRYD